MKGFEKYVGLNDENLLKEIENDYGKEARDHLESYGVLTLNEAIKYRNKILYESLGIIGYGYGHDGDLFGWVYNEPNDEVNENYIVITFND